MRHVLQVMDLQRDLRTGGLRTDRAVLAMQPTQSPVRRTAPLGGAAAPQSGVAAVVLASTASDQPDAAAAAAAPAAVVQSEDAAEMQHVVDGRQRHSPAGSQQPLVSESALVSQTLQSGGLSTASLATAALTPDQTWASASGQSQQVISRSGHHQVLLFV